MGYFYLLGAILSENAGKVFDKLNYKEVDLDPRELLRFVFVIMTICTAAVVVMRGPSVPDFDFATLWPLILVVVFSFVSNMFDEISLKINDLSLREPLSNFRPILAGFIGYIIFPEERKLVLLAALVAGAFVVAWGIKPTKLKKSQKKGILYMAISVVAEAMLSNAYAIALESVAPEFIALTRMVFISLLLFTLFRPKKRVIRDSKKSLAYTVAAGVAYSAGAVAGLYALQSLGIVTTMLLLLLGPALRYISAYLFLGDKATKEQMISSGLLGLIAAGVAFL